MAVDRIGDRLGLARQGRGLDTFLADKDAQRSIASGPAGSVVDQAAHLTGPLPDPQWHAFTQALADQDVSKVLGGQSDLVRGISTQPEYFTSGETFIGHQRTQPQSDAPEQPMSVSVLKQKARPKPLGHEQFLTQLYGGA